MGVGDHAAHGQVRIETVEINGDVDIAGVRVSCGDIVFADDTRVCFIPAGRAQEVPIFPKATECKGA